MNKLTITLLLMAALVALNDVQADTPKADAPAAKPADATASTGETKPAEKAETKEVAKPEETAKPSEKTEQPSAKSAKDAKPKKGANVIPYPLETCIVTDNKLGSMGDPKTLIHEGQEIKVCCKPCIAKFEKDPTTYLEKLKKAS